MKKVLLSLLLIPMMISAQGLKITAITPTAICPGDSLHISVKFVPGNTTQIKLLGKDNGMNWQYDSTFIVTNWPKQGSIYTLNIKTNANIGMGWATIRTMAMPDSIHTIDAACGTAGINEYTPDGLAPIYYNLNGERTDKRAGVILIEQVGLHRRKIIVLE